MLSLCILESNGIKIVKYKATRILKKSCDVIFLSIEAIVHCIHQTTKQFKISIFVYCVIIFFDKRCKSPQGYLFSDIGV